MTHPDPAPTPPPVNDGQVHGLIHFAGEVLHVGPLMRQRCSWCGALLLEYDLTGIGFEVRAGRPTPTRPAMWQPGTFMLVDGGMKAAVPPAENGKLPAGTCAALDPAVTG